MPAGGERRKTEDGRPETVDFRPAVRKNPHPGFTQKVNEPYLSSMGETGKGV